MRFLLLLTALVSSKLHAAEIKVAAAADLKFAMEDIVREYERVNPGKKVLVTIGASGKFLQQIKEGAPFDIFFSADSDKPQALVAAGKGAGAVFPYATGHLVVWTKNESKLKLDRDLKVLLDPSIKHIAVAHPVHAPYGQAADAALKKAGIYEQVKSKLVIGENIAQTAQFVESGAAEIGLVAKSLAESPALLKSGRAVAINASLYTPLPQAGIILRGKNEIAALKFKSYFLGVDGRRMMASYGLDPYPPPPVASPVAVPTK